MPFRNLASVPVAGTTIDGAGNRHRPANDSRGRHDDPPHARPVVLGFRHDRQRPPLVVLEEGHPLLGAVGMPMDHVRRVRELRRRAPPGRVRRAHVVDPEVQDGLRRPRPRPRTGTAARRRSRRTRDCRTSRDASGPAPRRTSARAAAMSRHRAGDLAERAELDVLFHRTVPWRRGGCRAARRSSAEVRARLAMPSFCSALATWYFTASRLTPWRAAISRLRSPWRTASTTRHSAGVKTSGCAGRPRSRAVAMPAA